MSVLLPLLLLLGTAEPAPVPTAVTETVTETATTTNTAPLKVQLLPVAGDAADNRKTAVAHALLTRFKRFSALVISVGSSDGDCTAADDRITCLKDLAVAAGVDVVVAPGASAGGGDATVSFLVVDTAGTTLSSSTASVSRLDGTFDDASRRALQDLSSALLEHDPDHFSEGGVTTTTATTTEITTTTTRVDQDALRQGLLIGGATGLGVGAVAVIVGAVMGGMASSAESALTGLRVRYVASDGDKAILEEARVQQQAAADSAALWNGVGIPLVWSGVGVAVLGGAAIAAAVFGLPAPQEEAPGATDSGTDPVITDASASTSGSNR